jgi:hypothetical protein
MGFFLFFFIWDTNVYCDPTVAHWGGLFSLVENPAVL